MLQDITTLPANEPKQEKLGWTVKEVIGPMEKENMNCKPLHDNVIITRAKADDVSKGGIYIPTTAQEKTTEGTVVAVGDGLRAQDGTIYPLAVKPGDRVLFEKHAGAEVKINGEDFVVLREFNIICILNR